MADFNTFINLMKLEDVPVLGCIHTWINSSGSASSRLDRFLISEGLISDWKIVAQCSGSRDISDHRPVWIKSSNLDWGPKPFKVFNAWFQHKDFLGFVKTAWDSFQVRGKKYFVIREKFRMLKEKLIWWNKHVFGWIDLKIDDGVEELNELETDLAIGGDSLNPVEMEKRRVAAVGIWQNLHLKESMLKQKSRQKWIQEGDLNTKFFHASLKARNRRNSMISLHTGSGVVDNVDQIKEVVREHFCKRFSSVGSDRPHILNLGFNKLSEVDSCSLEEQFSREEIKAAIFACEGDKSPGPDGFNLSFIKRCWSIVGEDFVAFIQEFHHLAKLPKAMTASFIALIPKVDNPQKIEDFRPICLIGCFYKI
ncbi:uncharacterized protein LOC131650973 [Vicia villosa]|uniref:uncharacterized protein LOC131650973 n=1 Tax=Vicia villosa TaxID=3911 RepID=UPI00273A8A40|nr:uncharacterized protein LOC131650973 [Vicia villosa]